MARKPNYDFEKRRKEQERKKKKDAKREERLARRENGEVDSETGLSADDMAVLDADGNPVSASELNDAV